VPTIRGRDWAFSQRWFVASDAQTVLCPDAWESVGPGRGLYQERFGGFSDTNTLLIDKTRAEDVLRLWTIPIPGEEMTGIGSDRSVFAALKDRPYGTSGLATSYYVLRETDVMHPSRVRRIRATLEKNFGGFRAFQDGRFGDAAQAFQRYLAVGPRSGLGLAWLALTRMRAGLDDTCETLCDAPRESVIGDARDQAIDVLAGRRMVDTGLSDAERCCLEFFAGERALQLGDTDTAMALFESAANYGVTQPEAGAARAELRRLDRS